MRRFRVRDEHKVGCYNCYGNGCSYCNGRGWFETTEGREEREQAEDDWADAAREERMLRDAD